MGTLLVTNLTGGPIKLPDLHNATLQGGATTSFERSVGQFYDMLDTVEKKFNGLIGLTFTLSAEEVACGFQDPTAGGSAAPSLQRQLGGQDRDDVSFGAWPVSTPAELNADTLLSTLTVHRFDDSTEEGVGLGEYIIPAGATTLTLVFEHRGQSAGGGIVVPKLYWQSHGDDAVYGAASSQLLTGLTIPASTNWRITSETVTLATLGLSAGEVVQLELTRGGLAGDTLSGDWTLSISEVRLD